MKNEIRRCTCIDISVDGQGICKDNGLVIFVKGMIPGEEADVKIIADKKTMAYAIIDKMIKPSPYRVKSPCPISYKCGGCDFRYIAYDYQLELKKKLLENTFRRLDVKVLDVLAADNPDFYRNKVQVPVRDGQFGFYRKFSNDIVEFDTCYIQTDLSNRIVRFLKEELLNAQLDKYIRHILIKHATGTNEVMVGFITKKEINLQQVVASLVNEFEEVKSVIENINEKETNVILGDKEILLYGNDHIVDEFGGVKVKIALKSFYQVNHDQMIKLYSKVRDFADIDQDTNVLDLYSGIGSISLFLAKYAKHVTGVEIVKEAVENAKENVKLNGFDNCEYYLDDASKNFDEYLKNQDVVIVDPPRKGLSKELIESLNNSGIKKIVYVSCNPATLARDLEIFKEKYAFDSVQPVDMFPHTIHVETVVCLSKKNSKPKDYVKIGVDAEDYYKIKEGK